MEAVEAGLVFTPYQQAQFGVTKHSQSLQASNPLIHASTGGAAAATNTGGAAPFNVTGIPQNPGVAGTSSATLAVGGVKRVWGQTEEVKADEPAQSNSFAQPATLNAPSTGSFGPSSTTPAPAKKPEVPAQTKA